VQDPSNLGLGDHEKRLQIKFDMVLQVLVEKVLRQPDFRQCQILLILG